MESPNNSSPNSSSNSAPARPKLHPLVATAAGAVILLSVVGIGALVMNHSNATPSPYDAPVALQAQPAPTQPQATTPEQPAPRAASEQPAPARVASSTPTYHRPNTQPNSSSGSSPSAPSYGAPASGPYTPVYNNPPAVAQAAVCRDCGVVDSIRDIKVKGQGTGVGGVGGAVVGGLLGNTIGAGRGKALATVAGAVGGAFAGNAIEKNVRAEVEHQMVVRLDDGAMRTFTQTAPFAFGIGERVRIVDGRVQRG